jgi:hypothetical protein
MNAPNETVERELPLAAVDSSMASLITRSEIDVQIATAHKYPRSIKGFQSAALELSTLNEETARQCIYALPRDGKVIEGPSARFGEILIYAWGNCRAGARVVDDKGEFVTAQGVFMDLQRNTGIAYEVERRIVDKSGKRFKADMIGVTSNAACSIALRNAAFKGIPKALLEPMYQAARRVVMGDFKTLANRREGAIQEFVAYGVTVEMICAVLGVKGKEDIGLEQLVVLKGILTAIQDGDTTVEQAFSAENVGTAPLQRSRPKAPARPESAGGAPQEGAKTEAPAQATAPAPAETARKPEGERKEQATNGKPATDSQVRIIRAKMSGAKAMLGDKALTEPALCKLLKIETLEALPMDRVNEAIGVITNPPGAE